MPGLTSIARRQAWRVVLALGLPASAIASPPDAPPAEPNATAGATADEAASSGSADVPAGAASSDDFSWNYSWQGWDGLHMELVQKTPLDVSRQHFRLDQIRLAGSLGVRLDVDAAAFDTDGTLSDFDDGVALRRARVRLSGDAILGVPFRYKVEFGYVPNQFTLNNFYIAIPDVRFIGTLKFGQFSPAMGLELLTSSWDIALMEPSAALQALAPKTSPGVQIGRPYADGRGTWAVGLYGSGGGSVEYGSLTKNMTNAVARVTWLAIDDMNPEVASSNHYLHLGLSATRQRSSDGGVSYRSRPESYIAPYVIQTGSIATDRAYSWGGELLWVRGPFAAQAEVIRSTVQPTGQSSLLFWGGYAFASWSLTGESRAYDRDAGTLDGVKPLRNFEFGPQGGWGAIEAAVRYTYTDLNDGFVHGGRLSLLMAGLDWTFRPQLQWMLNLGFGSVRGGATEGNMLIVQTRLGLNF